MLFQSHSYAVGVYEVDVNLTSELNRINFNWTQYVENEVKGLELVHETYIPTSQGRQNVGIRMTDPSVSPLLQMSCMFNVDGTIYNEVFNLSMGNNATVVHTFTGKNDFKNVVHRT